MNLTIEQARELGEALLDACENSTRTGSIQAVAFIDENIALAMPVDAENDLQEVDYVATVLT